MCGYIRSLLKPDDVEIDNSVFRLHYKVTVVLLVVSGLVLFGAQYIGKPLNCHADVDVAWETLNDYCSMNALQKKHEGSSSQGFVHYEDDAGEVPQYYRWAWISLLLQAVSFYVTRYLWKVTEDGKMKNLSDGLKKLPATAEETNQRIRYLVEYFDDNLNHHGYYALKYFILEVLNFANVLSQIFFTDAFLDYPISEHGTTFLSFPPSGNGVSGGAMDTLFPKTAKCVFVVHSPSGTLLKYDSICHITINTITEKVYLVVFTWFFSLATISAGSLIYRLLVLISTKLREIRLKAKVPSANPKQLEQICMGGGYGDWFVLYLLGKNINMFCYKKFVSDFSERDAEVEKV